VNLKNSLKLTFLNNNMVLKSLIYRLFIFVLYILFSFLILQNILSYLYSYFANFTLSKEFLKEFLNTIKYLISNNTSKVIWFIVLSFFAGLLNNFADTSIVDIVNKHMSTLSREGFFGSLFRNFKLALIYGLAYSVFNMIFCIVNLVLSYLIILCLVNVIGLFAVPLAIIIFVIVLSLKQTLISLILPNCIINEYSLIKALKHNSYNKKFRYLLASYIFAYSLIIYINVSAGILTCGAGLILSIPLSHILIDVLGLTSYYELYTMKYYITYDSKYIPKELRDNEENLLKDMSI